MPIYEYVCSDCKHEFELLVRHDTDCACPQCQSRRLEKKLSVVAGHTAGGKSLPMMESGPCSRPGCPPGGCGGGGF